MVVLGLLQLEKSQTKKKKRMWGKKIQCELGLYSLVSQLEVSCSPLKLVAAVTSLLALRPERKLA